MGTPLSMRSLLVLVLALGIVLALLGLHHLRTEAPGWNQANYVVLPPFDLLPLAQLEVEPLRPEHMFRVPANHGKFKNPEDRSLLRLLPHSIHKYVCELNQAALDSRGLECSQALPLDIVLNIVLPPRRVYLDLGAKTFYSSVGWFKSNYPVEFTQIYAWEMRAGKFVKPSAPEAAEKMKLSLAESQRWLDSITSFTVKVTAQADHSDSDLVHFLQTHVRREDFVVMKMDIENDEWKVIPWLEATGALHLVDEFFAEVHFNHSVMLPYRWDIFDHTLEEATEMLQRLRRREDLVFHYWP